MTVALNEDLRRHWTAVRPFLLIRNEREYQAAIKRLNSLLDLVGDDEQHPLFDMVDTLGTLIHAYEEVHHAMPKQIGADILRYLMEEHGLTQKDLSEVGSQGVVSEILNGKRELNIRQVRALAQRFHVSPSVFI